jgi:hypothetical protein
MQGQRETGRRRRHEEISNEGEESVERSAKRIRREEDESSSHSSESSQNSSISSDIFFEDGYIDRLEIWSDTLRNWLKTGNALTPYVIKGQEYPTIFHALYQEGTETQEMFPHLLEEALDYERHDKLRNVLQINDLKQRLVEDPGCRESVTSLYTEAEASLPSGSAASAERTSSAPIAAPALSSISARNVVFAHQIRERQELAAALEWATQQRDTAFDEASWRVPSYQQQAYTIAAGGAGQASSSSAVASSAAVISPIAVPAVLPAPALAMAPAGLQSQQQAVRRFVVGAPRQVYQMDLGYNPGSMANLQWRSRSFE